MIRPYVSLACIAVLSLSACTKQPRACFSVPELVEVNQPVHFENCSFDSHSYYWWFDDSTTSDEHKPVKAYTQRGKYLVYLTAYSKNTNKQSKTNEIIQVGNRFLTLMVIRDISFTQPNNQPWDGDGTGPDVRLTYGPVSQGGNTFTLQELTDLQPGQLPFEWAPLQDMMLTDEPWRFTLLEISPGGNRVMKEWELNPVDFAVKDVWHLTSSKHGNWHVEVHFTIK